MAKPWTQKELDFLEEVYSTYGPKYIAKKLNRSRPAIIHKAQRMNLSYHTWTQEELEFLEENYPKYGSKYVSEKLNRSDSAVSQKAVSLKIARIGRRRTWTKEEIKFLEENYLIYGIEYIAERLERSCGSIKIRMRIMHLKKLNPRKRMRKLNARKCNWTQEELKFLEENYPKYGSKYVAENLNKDRKAIRAKVNVLGIKYLWTEKEIKFLEENYSVYGAKYVAEKLNKKSKAVIDKAGRLGIRYIQPWTQEEIDFLANHYVEDGPKYVVEKLNKGYAAIVRKARKMGLQYDTFHWTQKDIDFMIKYYPTQGSAYIAEKMGKSCSAIRVKAFELGLKYLWQYANKKCKVSSCNEAYYAKGYCEDHYHKASRNGIFSESICKNEDCNNIAIIMGFCYSCYYKDYVKRYPIKVRESSANYRKHTRGKRIRLKLEAFTIYEGCCQNCGNDDLLVFEWHHRIKEVKRVNAAKIEALIVANNRKLENVMLLCANCHIRQNLIDGTSKQGIRLLNVSQNIMLHCGDTNLKKAFEIYSKKCQCCGTNDPLILRWHHRDGRKEEQINALARRIRNVGSMFEDVMLVCGNCHVHQNLKDNTIIPRIASFFDSIYIEEEDPVENAIKIYNDPVEKAVRQFLLDDPVEIAIRLHNDPVEIAIREVS